MNVIAERWARLGLIVWSRIVALATLTAVPALALAQQAGQAPGGASVPTTGLRDTGSAWGWGWFWLLVLAIVVIALVAWSGSRRRGGRPPAA